MDNKVRQVRRLVRARQIDAEGVDLLVDLGRLTREEADEALAPTDDARRQVEIILQRDAAVKALRGFVEQGKLEDADLETVPEAFARWTAGDSVSTGDVRRYGMALYRCVQGHTTQADWTPEVTPALWQRLGAAGEADECLPWVQPQGAHDAYKRGDRVTHNGAVWVSTADSNVWVPGVYGWERE